jgi:ABC-type nitrate/sulfonate/bicarbonate transport system ATPase subunit
MLEPMWLFIVHQIDEAIYLADRALVSSHWTCRIAADIRLLSRGRVSLRSSAALSS